MAEDGDQEPDAEAVGEAPGKPEGGLAAIALARAAGRGGGKPDPLMDAFLEKQARLIDLQMEHLHEERDLQHRHGRLKYFGDRLKVGLQLLTMAAGLAVATGVAALVWNAATADNLVIEAFSVPPALAERGITGESLARQLIEDLAAINEVGHSQDRQRGFATDWGKALALEVPETGISLAQVDQWLKDKLGHQVQVNAELVIAPGGALTLVAHSGAHAIAPILGDETVMPAMIQRVAEGVYAREQAKSYGGYLLNRRRFDEAAAWLRPRTHLPLARDRARAFNGLGLCAMMADRAQGGEFFLRAISADPTYGYGYGNLADVEVHLGHLDHALSLYRRSGQLLRKDRQILAAARTTGTNDSEDNTTALLGDYGGQFAAQMERRQLAELGTTIRDLAEPKIATTLARLHDLRGARTQLDVEIQTADEAHQKSEALQAIEISGENWSAAQAAGTQAGLAPNPLVLAHLGRIDEALALIGATRLDNVSAVIERGRIAALAGDAKGADHWFSEAVRMAPSLPMANSFWGRALLDRGDLAGAIVRLSAANRQGPRFADPISFWGEALLKQGKAGPALANFREADKYAPRWGRNHMLWGEALATQGRAAEAKVQFTAAAGLDLTAAERAELAKAQAHSA